MKKKIENTLDNFLSDEDERKAVSDKIKHVKSDFAIIERVDKIILVENGKQLLREQY